MKWSWFLQVSWKIPLAELVLFDLTQTSHRVNSLFLRVLLKLISSHYVSSQLPEAVKIGANKKTDQNNLNEKLGNEMPIGDFESTNVILEIYKATCMCRVVWNPRRGMYRAVYMPRTDLRMSYTITAGWLSSPVKAVSEGQNGVTIYLCVEGRP